MDIKRQKIIKTSKTNRREDEKNGLYNNLSR